MGDRRRGTVASAGLGQDASEVGLDGGFGEVGVGRDLAVGLSLPYSVEDFESAFGQRGKCLAGLWCRAGNDVADEASCDARIEKRFARCDATHGGDELFRRSRFEKVAAGSGPEGSVDGVSSLNVVRTNTLVARGSARIASMPSMVWASADPSGRCRVGSGLRP